MDPISNVDRLVLLLQRRLQERSRALGLRTQPPPPRKAGSKSALERIAALSTLEERQFKRALIEQILADQFGAVAINDARFQQIVDRVTETLDAEPEGQRLFSAVIADLRDAR